MQKKLLYKTNYLGCNIKVFSDRVVFKMFVGENSIPINQISSVQLGMMGLWQIIIETTGGKKYKIPTHKKKEVRQAIYKAQSNFSTNTNSVSTADEILKLNELKKEGILTQEEFDIRKKQLLEK